MTNKPRIFKALDQEGEEDVVYSEYGMGYVLIIVVVIISLIILW